MSVEILHRGNMGNSRTRAISFVATGAEAEIDTTLAHIEVFAMMPKSVTTSFYTAKQNEDSSGVASGGVIGASGLTLGDEFHILAIGN